MRRFKPGDELVCVNNDNTLLKIEDMYVVIRAYYDKNFKRVILRDHDSTLYFANRFQLSLKSQRKEKLKRLKINSNE